MTPWRLSGATRAELRGILGAVECEPVISECERVVFGYRTLRGGRNAPDPRTTLAVVRAKAVALLSAIERADASVRCGNYALSIPDVAVALPTLIAECDAEFKRMGRAAPHRPADKLWRDLCIHVAFLLVAVGLQPTTARPEGTARKRLRGAILWRVLEVLSREARGDRPARDLSRDVRTAVDWVRARPFDVHQARAALDHLRNGTRKNRLL